VKYPLFLSDFNETRIFSIDYKKTQISILMKIHPEGAELFHVDGQTDMTKLTVALLKKIRILNVSSRNELFRKGFRTVEFAAVGSYMSHSMFYMSTNLTLLRGVSEHLY
jgi:hypothetical protein